MAKKSAKSIVEEALPGRVVIDSPTLERATSRGLTDSLGVQPDGDLDLEALRAKFLGTSVPSVATAPASDFGVDRDVEVCMTRSANLASDAIAGNKPGAKAVLVSKSKGKIVGYQG